MRKLTLLFLFVPCLLWGQTIQNLAPFVLTTPSVVVSTPLFDVASDSLWDGGGLQSVAIKIPITVTASSNRILLAYGTIHDGLNQNPLADSVKSKLSGAKLTMLDSTLFDGAPATHTMSVWYLINPTSGNDTVTVYRNSGGSSDPIRGTWSVVSYYNTNQGGGASSIALGLKQYGVAGTEVTGTSTSASGEKVALCSLTGITAIDSCSQGTVTRDLKGGTAQHYAIATGDKAGATSVTLGYKKTDGGYYGLFLLRLKP